MGCVIPPVCFVWVSSKSDISRLCPSQLVPGLILDILAVINSCYSFDNYLDLMGLRCLACITDTTSFHFHLIWLSIFEDYSSGDRVGWELAVWCSVLKSFWATYWPKIQIFLMTLMTSAKRNERPCLPCLCWLIVCQNFLQGHSKVFSMASCSYSHNFCFHFHRCCWPWAFWYLSVIIELFGWCLDRHWWSDYNYERLSPQSRLWTCIRTIGFP